MKSSPYTPSTGVKPSTAEIEAIFLDLGNTLRILYKDEQHQSRARENIARLINSSEAAEILCERLDERYKVYRKWAFQTKIEASEAELWTKWLLPELPADSINPIAIELTFEYRQTMGKRIIHPDAHHVITELTKRSYRLGIISNVITSQEVPDWLEEDGLTEYFKAVVLSSVYGRRKPDPEIYWEGSRLIDVPPERCVYVGDNLLRDVEGTQKAGFGLSIILIEKDEYEKQLLKIEHLPDVVIYEFSQLLDLFPGI
jgi:HAD superfamily hydrolase (TIGR01549 family)